MTIVRASVERPVHGGRFLATTDDGARVLISGALPGETVRARVDRRQGVLLGTTVEVLEPSPDRVEPSVHPGLDLAHARYERQLELKRDVVEDAYRRAIHASATARGSGDLELGPVIPSPLVWGYRATIQPAVARAAGTRGAGAHDAHDDRAHEDGAQDPASNAPVAHAPVSPDPGSQDGGPEHPAPWGAGPQAAGPQAAGTPLGYRAPGSHRVVALDHDPTANEACARGWDVVRSVQLPGGVREVAMRGGDEGEVLLALVATTAVRDLLDVAHALVRAGVHGVVGAPYDPRGRFRGGAQRLAGARSIRQRYGDVELTLTGTSFAQPNPSAAHGLYRTLAAWAPPARHALDLYAGNGVIGMHLAPTCELVTVVDIDRGSIDRGRRDAERAGLGERMRYLRADARTFDPPADLDLVAVDPPRAGLATAVRDAIHATAALTLLYVSCDPATWARDVADLAGRGWRLQRVQAFDFQPHTHHVELLSLLHRDASRR